MRFWTLQSIDAYDYLMKNKVLRQYEDGKDQFFNNVKIPYQYMRKKLLEYCNIENTEENRYPIWIWDKFNGKRRCKVDTRLKYLGPKGTSLVQLTIDVDPKRVLISDFSLWHIPLNISYLSKSKYEEENIEAYYNKKPFKDLTNEDYKVLEKSWDIIFDLDYCKNNIYLYDNNDIQITQGVIWEIKMEDIISIEKFEVGTNKKCYIKEKNQILVD